MTAQSTRSGNTAGGQRQPLQQDALLTGIRNANYHEGGIRCLQLFHVNETMLASVQADVDRLCRNETGSNVTDLDHMLWAMITRTDPKESIQFITGSWDSNADPAIPPERRKSGDITHSVALINACKPWHWRDDFPPSNTPSAAVARKAREKFGWLLDGTGRA